MSVTLSKEISKIENLQNSSVSDILTGSYSKYICFIDRELEEGISLGHIELVLGGFIGVNYIISEDTIENDFKDRLTSKTYKEIVFIENVDYSKIKDIDKFIEEYENGGSIQEENIINQEVIEINTDEIEEHQEEENVLNQEEIDIVDEIKEYQEEEVNKTKEIETLDEIEEKDIIEISEETQNETLDNIKEVENTEGQDKIRIENEINIISEEDNKEIEENVEETSDVSEEKDNNNDISDNLKETSNVSEEKVNNEKEEDVYNEIEEIKAENLIGNDILFRINNLGIKMKEINEIIETINGDSYREQLLKLGRDYKRLKDIREAHLSEIQEKHKEIELLKGLIKEKEEIEEELSNTITEISLEKITLENQKDNLEEELTKEKFERETLQKEKDSLEDESKVNLPTIIVPAEESSKYIIVKKISDISYITTMLEYYKEFKEDENLKVRIIYIEDVRNEVRRIINKDIKSIITKEDLNEIEEHNRLVVYNINKDIEDKLINSGKEFDLTIIVDNSNKKENVVKGISSKTMYTCNSTNIVDKMGISYDTVISNNINGTFVLPHLENFCGKVSNRVHKRIYSKVVEKFDEYLKLLDE